MAEQRNYPDVWPQLDDKGEPTGKWLARDHGGGEPVECEHATVAGEEIVVHPQTRDAYNLAGSRLPYMYAPDQQGKPGAPVAPSSEDMIEAAAQKAANKVLAALAAAGIGQPKPVTTLPQVGSGASSPTETPKNLPGGG